MIKIILIVNMVLILFSCTVKKSVYSTALLGSIIEDFEPAHYEDYNHYTLFSQTCGRLTSVEQDMTILGDVAIDWKILENGMKYEFLIDRKRAFSDGSLTTTEDILFSIKRLKKIKGGKSLVSKNIKSVKIKDKNHIEIILKKRDTNFLFLLSTPELCILSSQKPFHKVGGIKVPNSNGSYHISSVGHDVLTLKSNPNVKVLEEEIKVYFLSQKKSVEKFKNGELHDLSFFLLDKDELKSVESKARKIRAKIFWTWAITLNDKIGIFKKISNRKKIIENFNKKLFLKSWNSNVIPGSSVIPNGMLQEKSKRKYQPNDSFENKILTCDKKIKVAVIEGIPSYKKIKSALEIELGKLFICNVEIEKYSMGLWHKVHAKGEHHLYVYGLEANSNDPISYYRFFIKDNNVNALAYDNEVLNQAYDAIQNKNFHERTADDYKNISKILTEMYFVIPLGTPYFDFVYSLDVDKAHMNPLGMPYNKWKEIGRKK